MPTKTPPGDRERILGELRALSPLPLTSRDIADELRLKPGRARKLLLELQRAGRVAEKGTAKPTQAKLYYIPEGAA